MRARHPDAMPAPPQLPTLLLLLLAQCAARTLSTQAIARGGLPDRAGEGSTSSLALGEPCGVYTLSCAKGLRCVPPAREQSPLQALLQGRGVCAKQSHSGPGERPTFTVTHPSSSSDLEKAPCRKLLNSVLRGLELTVFPSTRDIYIPNCNTRGFYRKKQCRSSKGMQRGHCWCVDEHGAKLQARAGEDGALPCDGE